uniref:Uncharacterized protein n=1 Tax=Knipowitschia caucasica TaxID=637954 RepID=A0AAV2JFC7_KNICA
MHNNRPGLKEPQKTLHFIHQDLANLAKTERSMFWSEENPRTEAKESLRSSRGRSPQIHHRHRGTFRPKSKPRKHRLREGGGDGVEVEQFSIREDMIEGQRSSLRVQEHTHST